LNRRTGDTDSDNVAEVSGEPFHVDQFSQATGQSAVYETLTSADIELSETGAFDDLDRKVRQPVIV
jgi:hypothetical protein